MRSDSRGQKNEGEVRVQKLMSAMSRLSILYSMLIVLAGGATWEMSVGFAGPPSRATVPSVVEVTPTQTQAQSSVASGGKRDRSPERPARAVAPSLAQVPPAQSSLTESGDAQSSAGSSSVKPGGADSSAQSHGHKQVENQLEVVSPTVVVMETPVSFDDQRELAGSRDSQVVSPTSQSDSNPLTGPGADAGGSDSTSSTVSDALSRSSSS
jgi:hypothetical protein